MSFVSLQRTKNKKKNKKKKKKKGSEYRALLEAYVMMLVWVDTRSPDFFFLFLAHLCTCLEILLVLSSSSRVRSREFFFNRPSSRDDFLILSRELVRSFSFETLSWLVR